MKNCFSTAMSLTLFSSVSTYFSVETLIWFNNIIIRQMYICHYIPNAAATLKFPILFYQVETQFSKLFFGIKTVEKKLLESEKVEESLNTETFQVWVLHDHIFVLLNVKFIAHKIFIYQKIRYKNMHFMCLKCSQLTKCSWHKHLFFTV